MAARQLPQRELLHTEILGSATASSDTCVLNSAADAKEAMIAAEFSFGCWLQQRRKVLGLTQKELAQRVGCAAETLRKIEADARRPSHQVAELLAHALELPSREHTNFIRAARSEQRVDQLVHPTQDVTQLTFCGSSTLTHENITYIEGRTCMWERVETAIKRLHTANTDLLLQMMRLQEQLVMVIGRITEFERHKLDSQTQ